MHRRAVSPVVRVALVGLAVHVVLVGLFLARYDGDAAWFVHFGRDTVPTPLAQHVLGADVIVPHVDGHDGRFFWVLARDPLLLHPHDVASNLDRPGYRVQRVLYPLLAAPWRVAGENALVWGLLVNNLVIVFVGGLVAGSLAVALRAPPRAAYAFALSPAVLIATVMDGSDALALAALLGTVLFVVRGRTWPAVCAAVVAVLAKEPSLLGLAGLAVLAPRVPRRTRVAIVAVPTVAAVAWGLYARARLGWPASGVEEFAAPFYGYVDAYRRGWRPVGNWGDAAAAAVLVPLLVVIAVRWWRRPNALLAAALPFVALVPFFSAQVLDLMVNTMRAVGPAITLLWLDAYSPTPAATSNSDPPAREVLRAIRRWGSRGRPSPVAPHG